MKKNSIAILYIALGDYKCFWEDFYNSFESRFLTGCSKKYYVFTDDRSFFSRCSENVQVIDQENLGWPGNTLYRFEMFLSIRERLINEDYVFFFNANYLCNKEVGLGDVFFLDAALLCVAHPGFYGLSNYYYNYDRNKKSLAFVPYGEGECYIQGCFLGGKPNAFLEMCEKLSDNIRIDDEHGVLAEWHDESHVNRYIIGRNDVTILGPEFAYPEFGKTIRKNEIVLLLRDKEKYIQYKGKKKRSKYWFYYKKKRVLGMMHEQLSKIKKVMG